jgi:DHA1 family multidrug resistance protein-like MFS transporter
LSALSAGIARRNERVMAFVVFVVFTGFAFVLPFLPLYVRQLGIRDESDVALWAGVLIGVSPLLAGMLSPLWGRLADRYGHKVMATRALVSYVFLLALSAAVRDVWQLFALRVGIGLFGGIGPLGLVMASASAPKGEAGRAIGVMQAAQILAAAVGPFSGGLLADSIGIRPTFLVTAVLCGIALAVLRLFYEDPARPIASASAVSDSGVGRDRAAFALYGLMAVLFFVNFVGRSFTPVLPLQIERLGVSPSRSAMATGLLVSAYSMAAAISAATLGRAARTRSARRLLLLSLAAAALLLAPIAWASSFRTLLALATALGFTFGGALTLCYTMGDSLAPAGRRGATFGLFTGAALFGGALSPSVAGLLARWDLSGIYYLDAALCVLLVLGLGFPAMVTTPLAASAD